MQVVFTTVFLALVVGTQTVKVEVEGTPDSVEFYLDGVLQTTDTLPPWRARVDLGDKLAPHELEAVALDAEGNEVGRRMQWVNLPRAETSLQIVVERDDKGSLASARLVASSSAGLRPEDSNLDLDGKSLEPGPDGAYPLPPMELSMPHFLRASALFPNGRLAMRELVLGGSYGGETSARITAVPVSSRRRPEAEYLGALIALSEGETRVEAVEKSGSKIFVVVDGNLRGLLRSIEPSVGGVAGIKALIPPRPDPKLDLCFVVRPVPEVVARGRQITDAFGYTMPMMITSRAPLDWHLTRLDVASHDPAAQRLADAVAVAGVRAAGTQCPRVVLLLVASGSPDRSQFSPAEVRRFLETLHVPLVVLRWGEPLQSDPWGTVIEMGDRRNLRVPMSAVRGVLGRQWIAWVEGTHPLHHVDVRGDARVGPVTSS